MIEIPSNVAVSDSGFLFLPSTGETFTLNQIGKSVFTQLKNGASVQEIIKILNDEYDTDIKSLERDVEDFILQLKNYGLVKEA